jgi:hypothetical protein
MEMGTLDNGVERNASMMMMDMTLLVVSKGYLKSCQPFVSSRYLKNNNNNNP